ncbi:MAG TPA: AMP-binding protein [Polyangiales bacterium]|nr:AMP-binding protein [Polyangiales bacterium]
MAQKNDLGAWAEAIATGMYVAHWATVMPSATAVIGDQGRLTFAELNGRANQLARALRACGLKTGDGLAILSHNSFEFVETFLATRRIGVRLTPLNFHLGPEEAGYILRDCDAKVFISADRFAQVAIGAAAGAPMLQAKLAAGGDISGFESYRAFVDGQDPTDIEDPVLGTNMLYTSGTTGKPKGVQRPPLAAAMPGSSMAPAAYKPGVDLHLCTGPLYHAAPLGFSLMIPLVRGIGVVLMDGWDAEQTLKLIDEHHITHTHMVPTMFHRMLALPDEVRARYDVSSLTMVLHGAAPCPVPLKQSLIEWLGPVVYEYYGATEGIGTFVDSETWLRKPGTVGQPFPPDQVRILDDDGNEVPRGTTGSVYLKAPAASRFRYYKDQEKTQAAFRGDYFTLGDIGHMDGDGYLFLTDRSANLIISGGVNIYPAETDAVLLTHPAVSDVAVIGVPNDEWGEEVKAVVELRPEYSRSAALERELIEYCRGRLAHYKCPRSVDFVDKLPRFDNGKIYKHALREGYRRSLHK